MRSTWGSIRCRGNSWELRYTRGGKAVSETVRGSRVDAERRLAELRCLEEGKPVRMTFQTLWDCYYRPSLEGLAPSTIAGYESAWRCHLGCFAGTDVDSLTPTEVQAWLDSLSYGQARKAFAVLRAMCTYAVDMELTERNVCLKHYRMPENRQREPSDDVMPPNIMERVADECRGEFWEGSYLASAFAGLRREEALALKGGDVTLMDGYAFIDVRRGVQVIEHETVITPLKTEGSYRTAVIMEPYASRLAELSDGWICGDGLGNVSNPDTAACAYRRFFTRKPYAYVPWKNLRASYATMLHDSGVDMATIARLLGHTSVETTYRHYDSPSAEQTAAKLIRDFTGKVSDAAQKSLSQRPHARR